MLKRVQAANIDKIKWDACISAAGSVIYGLSWYLDIVAPDWEAIVEEENDLYVTVLPLTFRKKAGYRMVAQPLFCQQLGIFSRQKKLPPDYLLKIITLAFPANCAVQHYAFQADNLPWLSSFFSVQERSNAIINCIFPYPDLYQKFNANRKRDLLKSSKANVQWREGPDYWPVLWDMYQDNVVKTLPANTQRQVVALLPNLVKAAIQRNMAIIAVAVLTNGEICAGVLFLKFKNRVVYLLPTTTAIGKQVGAATFLINHILFKNAGTPQLLDLEGSQLAGVARFYKSLGAESEYYGVICNLRLPWTFKIYRYLKNGFQI